MDDEEDVANIEAFRVFERFESLTRDPDEPIEAYIAEFMLRLEQCEKMSLICLKKYLAFKMLHNSGASDEEKELILRVHVSWTRKLSMTSFVMVSVLLDLLRADSVMVILRVRLV